MAIKRLTKNEVKEMWVFIEELAQYHNSVSENFKGLYPMDPPVETIKNFEDDVESEKSVILVDREEDVTKGFIKLDFDQQKGAISYFFVKEEYRGAGTGRALIDEAMKWFKKQKVKQIDAKVVYGNPAAEYYEGFGFKKQQYIMTLNL
jgi:ribosomal protein S18 acetylase RimI-like enzyme